ncbi:MAG: hypothetical protein M0C28_31260 [Candidatus Moduliflexus flocculans]|nr:hypothetical protein [Candidatus Moduliflexus flocculans]
MAHNDDRDSGKLKIGDHWNAITIIALSQNNPLKRHRRVRGELDRRRRQERHHSQGKHKNDQYLKIVDDGSGIKDFRYVATHIGDSIKRELKRKGEKGLQGEFGIGLLSFGSSARRARLRRRARTAWHGACGWSREIHPTP